MTVCDIQFIILRMMRELDEEFLGQFVKRNLLFLGIVCEAIIMIWRTLSVIELMNDFLEFVFVKLK